jgi:hypothetical protein
MQLDLGALKKMRAQFEIRPLDSKLHSSFPEEAIRCSSSALDMLNVLHGEAEDARNACEYPLECRTLGIYQLGQQYWRQICTRETTRSGVAFEMATTSASPWW